MAPRFTQLNDWLSWQESHHPSEIDLGLARVRDVAERLDLLSPQARIITIAGTNGKGSCVAALESLMSAAGQSFGAFTSPHLLHYNERIRLQGKPVSDAVICDAFDRIDRARQDISLTYFEFGTLAAMVIFNDQPLDYWLLEVGLGGRLDAVNIIDPSIAVITSIALDHQAWLGDTREKIGFEKAGICRANAPLICTDPEPPQSIRDRVTTLGCHAIWLGKDFQIEPSKIATSAALSKAVSNITTSSTITFKTSDNQSLAVSGLQLPAPSVAAALEVMVHEGLLQDVSSIKHVLESAGLAGRFQTAIWHDRPVVLDVAHNPAAAQLLADRIAQHHFGGVDIVVAMMADKDIAQVLEPLLPHARRWYCAELSGNPRAAKAKSIASILVDQLEVNDSHVRICNGVEHALAEVAEGLQPRTSAKPLLLPILICGSFFTVAEALKTIQPATTANG